ncbi:MAG TPA: ShlB/FhaC/HecB family hemolysin secretion/activation protein [Alphaproteobacteria bacterium]|nr:ShlB/FhaC/HecB family hemolysin secretion/activation protein [Alphaproteobacteria bacterium]HNS44211.1 ShlB/FhaC/HecB family hemolysin secretion/activation protein [Alphaproteobacteria bacterium]
MRVFLRYISLVFVAFLALYSGRDAFAQTIPGPADIDRVAPAVQEILKIEPVPSPFDLDATPGIRYSRPPANADQIKLILRSVKVEGVSVYSAGDIEALYSAHVGKEITLGQIWKISDTITNKYRQDGYFLSRAYIPAQEIADGTILIKVAEGYIRQVEVGDDLRSNPLVQNIISQITSKKPISSGQLERCHLLLTDLPGLQNLFGTLVPIAHPKDGGVKLVYSRNETRTSSGFIGINNFGSKFLGPTQAVAQWQGNLFGTQESFLALRSSLPLAELKAINVSQRIPLTPVTDLTFSTGYTRAQPGFTLSPQEIESYSADVGLNLTYKIIRQRTENWSISVSLDGRNSKSTILGTTQLSEDRIRAVRFGTSYDTYDSLGAYNLGTLTVSKGLGLLGSSKKGDIDISRDGAEPNFTKAELEYIRYQPLPEGLLTVLSAKAQKASGSLYSSEEFGFGGQYYGRAYDSSELTGDDGVSASIELQYNDLPQMPDYTFQPYTFYDIGKVWNANNGQVDSISASSAGLGLRFTHLSGLSGSMTMAFPLTKKIDTPIYGGSETDPRFSFQVGYKF